MRFLQMLTESGPNIPPNKVPNFDDFWRFWKTEIENVMPADEFKPEHLQKMVDRINAVDFNNLYRGIVVTETFLENLKPGMELGSHWTWKLDVAASFANGGGAALYDDRFDDMADAVHKTGQTYHCILHAMAHPSALNIWYTLGNSIDDFEYEIDLVQRQPIVLKSVMIAPSGKYSRKGPEVPLVTHTQFAGNYYT